MKKLLLLILILTLSCENDKLDGLWYGEFKGIAGRNPILLKFENKTIIDYFSYPDTTRYKQFGNKIYFKNSLSEKRELKISILNDELILFDSKADTLIVKLKRKQGTNFIFDYLNDKGLNIDIPSGQGLERTFGLSHRFTNPLYLSYKNNKLVANFFDTTVSVDSNYYKFLFNKIDSTGQELFEYEKNNVSLIADRNIKNSDLNLLKKQLKIAGYSSIDYLLSTDSYDKINYFSLRLKQLTSQEKNQFNIKSDSLDIELPSGVESALFHKEKILLLEVMNDSVKINNTVTSNSEFKSFIDSKIKSDTVIHVYYYLSENSVYQNFIDINDDVINSIYNARDNYLYKKYGFKFREYNRFKGEEIKKSQMKIPLILGQLNSSEYKKIKNSL